MAKRMRNSERDAIKAALSKKRCIAGGIGLTALGILSLFSVYSHNVNDLWFAADGHSAIANWCGYAGALLASHVLGSYGLVGYLIPPVLLIWGTDLLRRKSMAGRWNIVLGTVLIIATLSIAFGQTSLEWVRRLGANLPAGPGGIFGGLLAGNLLRSVVGSFGLMLTIISLLLFGLSMIAGGLIEALFAKIGRRFARLAEYGYMKLSDAVPAMARVGTAQPVGSETALYPHGTGAPVSRKKPASDSNASAGATVAVIDREKRDEHDVESDQFDDDMDDIEILIGGMEPNDSPILAVPGADTDHDALLRDDGTSDSDSDIIVHEPADNDADEAGDEEPDAFAGSARARTDSQADMPADSKKTSEPERGDNAVPTEEPDGDIVNPDSNIQIEMAYEDQKASNRIPDILKPKKKRKKKKKPTALAISEDEYELPSPALLVPRRQSTGKDVTERELQIKGMTLLNTLKSFKIGAKLAGIQHGPTITTYEIKLDPGINVKRIQRINDNLALDMNVAKVRITDPIEGRGTIGIEVPNLDRAIVGMREIMETKEFQKAREEMAIPLIIGRDTKGRPLIIDLHKAPHMLVGGATGMGKSVAINCLICSILATQTPHACKMILIDPKMVELSAYKGIPHNLAPVETDMGKAGKILLWAVEKMEQRYKMLEAVHARNISEYNAMPHDLRVERIKRFKTDMKEEDIQPFLPFIVIIVDEWADLIMQFREEAETAVIRITQKARAAGIHLILATQQPTTEVVTSLIKANIPTRIACKTNDHNASRVILNRVGAERLTGNGDMLVVTGTGGFLRAQGAYVSTEEVEAVVESVSVQAEPIFDETCGNDNLDDTDIDLMGEDPDMFIKAGDVIIYEKPSTSYVQRKLGLGYTRAARIVDVMVNMGLVRQNGSKGLEVIIEQDVWERVKARIRGEEIEEYDDDEGDQTAANEDAPNISADASEDIGQDVEDDENEKDLDDDEEEDDDLDDTLDEEDDTDNETGDDDEEEEDIGGGDDTDALADTPLPRLTPSMRLLKVQDDAFDAEFSEDDEDGEPVDNILARLVENDDDEEEDDSNDTLDEKDDIDDEGDLEEEEEEDDDDDDDEADDGDIDENTQSDINDSKIEFDNYEEDDGYDTLGDDWDK